ncbi:hypothetical protein Tco_0259609 [Tanacetum coccineum]
MENLDNIINQDEEHANLPIITNSKLEIGDEFLKILRDNAFNGMDGGDVTDHIAKVLEITEWIKMPNVEKTNYDYTSSQNHSVEMPRDGETMK